MRKRTDLDAECDRSRRRGEREVRYKDPYILVLGDKEAEENTVSITDESVLRNHAHRNPPS